jgi:chorismate mutase
VPPGSGAPPRSSGQAGGWLDSGRLLADRVRIAMATASLKQSLHLPIHAPERERDVLERIDRLDSSLDAAARRRIFSVVMETTLAVEQTLGPQADVA